VYGLYPEVVKSMERWLRKEMALMEDTRWAAEDEMALKLWDMYGEFMVPWKGLNTRNSTDDGDDDGDDE